MAEAPPQAFPILEHIDAEMVLKTVVGVTIAYVVNMMVTSALLQLMPFLLLIGFVGACTLPAESTFSTHTQLKSLLEESRRLRQEGQKRKDGGFLNKFMNNMTRKVEDFGASLLASAGEVTFTNCVAFRIARVAFDSDESKDLICVGIFNRWFNLSTPRIPQSYRQSQQPGDASQEAYRRAASSGQFSGSSGETYYY